MFKCIDVNKKTIVAIKERRDEKQLMEWRREMMLMKMIEKEVSSLIFPKMICVLDEKYSNVEQKYIVLEFVEGGNMKGFNQKFLKNNLFNSESDFIEMLLSFLIQVQLLHQNEIIHRDIKPGN